MPGKKKGKKPVVLVAEKNPAETWEIVREIGSGSFGEVFEAKEKNGDSRAALKKEEFQSAEELEDLLVEIKVLSALKHKNIVTFHEAYQFERWLWLFLEFCDCGSLGSVMSELVKPLTEAQIRYVARQVCEALAYLHSKLVIHRDVKADNVLLASQGDVKLADFGISAQLVSEKAKRDSFIGSPFWMAPEVIVCETSRENPYDVSCDIWSFGITLIELSEMNPPNHEMHPLRVFIKIVRGEQPTLSSARFSPDCCNFVAQCLVKDPACRANAQSLLEHPFVFGVSDNLLDRKPILALIAELRAEVVETIEELPADEIDVSPSVLPDTEGPPKRPPRAKDSLRRPPPPQVPIALEVDTNTPEEDSKSDTVRQFKTLRRTRKYIIDNVEQTSVTEKLVTVTTSIHDQQPQVQEVAASTSPDFTEYRKQDLREMKQLQRIESRRLQAFTAKRQAEADQMLQRHDADVQSLLNQSNARCNQLKSSQLSRYQRASQAQNDELRLQERKLRNDQEKQLRAFRENARAQQRSERASVEDQCSRLAKSERKTSLRLRLEELQRLATECEKQFVDEQKRLADETMKVLRVQIDAKLLECGRELLAERFLALQDCETELAKLREAQIRDRFSFESRFISEYTAITVEYLDGTKEKELSALKRLILQREDASKQIRNIEKSRRTKNIQSAAKVRIQEFRESLRKQNIRNPEEERTKLRALEETERQRVALEIQQLDDKLRQLRDELTVRNQQLFKDLEQIHEEKRRYMLQQQEAKLVELAERESLQRERLLLHVRDKVQMLKAALTKSCETYEAAFQDGQRDAAVLFQIMDSAVCSCAVQSNSVSPIVMRIRSKTADQVNQLDQTNNGIDDNESTSNLRRSVSQCSLEKEAKQAPVKPPRRFKAPPANSQSDDAIFG